MIEIIIATTTYPKKNWGISKMEEFLTEEIVSTGDIFLGAFPFSQIQMVRLFCLSIAKYI